MKKILLLFLTAALVINLIGCAAPSNSSVQDKVGVRGEITFVARDGNQTVTGILVEGTLESDTSYDKAQAGIDKNTLIYKKGTKQNLSANELKEGMTVEIIFEGPVAESYPVQAYAKTISVID